MSIDNLIEASVWVLSIILVLLFTPKKKTLNAHVCFLIAQVPTWFLGVLVVQLGLIEYPVHFFSKAVNTSFTFEFLTLPVVCIIYTLHYPEHKTKLKKVIFSVAFPVVLTAIEIILVYNTNLVHYIHWEWYYTLISTWFVLHISHLYTKWFFNTIHNHMTDYRQP